ncbi:hypothetical protein LguiB_010969 [Lonicera macranthoides]
MHYASVSFRWKHLWKLKIPAKTRFFLWRALSKCLPTRSVQATKHIEVPILCPVCNLNAESEFHILVACPKARTIWAMSEVKSVANSVKCNLDAAVFQASSRVWFGLVLRDEDGRFIAAKAGSFPGSTDPFIAEALSCRKALSWIKNCRVHNAIVETDSLLVFLALSRDASDCSYGGLILNDRKIRAKDLVNCRFSFTCRSANRVAHCLARTSDSLSEFRSWERRS